MGRDEDINPANGNYLLGAQRTHVTHILTRWDPGYASQTKEQAVEWLTKDIREHGAPARPAFMSVMALSWRYEPSDIVEVLRRLGSNYVAVTLPELTQLYRLHVDGAKQPVSRFR